MKSVKSVVRNPGMKHEELTKDIIGAAMAVVNELKPGLDEKLFKEATLTWKRVVRGNGEDDHRLRG